VENLPWSGGTIYVSFRHCARCSLHWSQSVKSVGGWSPPEQNATSWRRLRGMAMMSPHRCKVDSRGSATPQLVRRTQSCGVSPSLHIGSYDRQRLCKDAQNADLHLIDFHSLRNQKRRCAVLTSVRAALTVDSSGQTRLRPRGDHDGRQSVQPSYAS
jgi:hypothetical protein